MGSLDTPHTCLQHVSHTAGESQAVFMLRIEPLLTPRVYLLNLFNFISSWREEDDLQDQVNKERRCLDAARSAGELTAQAGGGESVEAMRQKAGSLVGSCHYLWIIILILPRMTTLHYVAAPSGPKKMSLGANHMAQMHR